MRTDRLFVVLMGLALCAIALNAMATDWYVDAVNGSHTTGDGSQGNPWKSITFALDNTTGTEGTPLCCR